MQIQAAELQAGRPALALNRLRSAIVGRRALTPSRATVVDGLLVAASMVLVAWASLPGIYGVRTHGALGPLAFWSGFVVAILVVARQLLARIENDALTQQLAGASRRIAEANMELRKADDLKDEFVAVACHEFRTPITNLRGFSTLLLERWDSLDEGQKLSHVRVLDRQSRRLARLSEDLLTMSRMQAGALTVRTQTLDVWSTVRRALEELGPKGQEVLLSCPRGLEIEADPDHVEQILLNYLGNALKYGEPPVSLDVVPHFPMVEIRVRDAGPGVAESFRPRLFDKFARGTGYAGPSGTGIGLHIVRGLAEAQGGRAWYEENLPAGACFIASFPAAPQPAGAPPVQAGHPTASGRRRAPI